MRAPCEGCGGSMEGKRSVARFCGSGCRVRHHRGGPANVSPLVRADSEVSTVEGATLAAVEGATLAALEAAGVAETLEARRRWSWQGSWTGAATR